MTTLPRRVTGAALAFLVASALVVGEADAQTVPCPNGPCLRREPPGTHFIAEVSGGATTLGSGGLALEGVLGVGGKLRGFPPRFYLIGEAAYNSGTLSSATPLAGVSYRDERTYRDLAGGLRVYLPIYGPVRIFADGLIGGSHVAASLDRQGLAARTAEGWLPLFALAGGLQVRIFRFLSVGMRAKFVLTDDDVAGLRQVVAAESPLRATVTAGLTWHF